MIELFPGPVVVDTKMYPNNEPLIVLEDRSRPHTIGLRQFVFQDFVNTMFLADAFRLRRKYVPRLVMPLVPGSRQDRVNDDGDFLFTLKSVADMVNARNFDYVHVVDPHSDVTPALLNNVVVHDVVDVFSWGLTTDVIELGKYTSVIAPDAGASKRAMKIANLFQIPFFQAWKERDIKTGKLAGFGIEQYADLGTHPLIVDDLCDGGGTFIGLVDMIDMLYGKMDKRREYNAMQFSLYVTHGLFTSGLRWLQDNFVEIITTDSVVHDGEIMSGIKEIQYYKFLTEATYD